jgi:phosphoglycerate kinase
VAIKTLDDLLGRGALSNGVLTGRRVFVRADLNVPLDAGRIRDDTRIRASLPTLERLRDAGARIILASHLGRPKGEKRPELTLEPVAKALSAALGQRVRFVSDCVGADVEAAVKELADGEILLLENLRFHPEETANQEAFARNLAALADVYVNDAFGTAHRAHASTTGIVPFVETAAAGLLLEKEIEALGSLLEPEHPFVCFLGGAKVSDKLGVLEALIERADTIGVGGAMAYTFLAAKGESVGGSLIEPDRYDDALRMIARAAERGCELMLPTDHVVAARLEDGAKTEIVKTIPEGQMGVDIGPDTAERYAAAALRARMILWNGPMGVFEIDAFSRGTERVAQGVAASEGRSVVGGGDSLAAVAKIGLGDQIDHLSTGGGASLEFVQGLVLPGIQALDTAR